MQANYVLTVGSQLKADFWYIRNGNTSIPLPTHTFKHLLPNITWPITSNLPNNCVLINSMKQTCKLWFGIENEDTKYDKFQVFYPCDIKHGKPIKVIVFTDQQSIEIPWVQGKPNISKDVLMPLFISTILECCKDIHCHYNTCHTTSELEQIEPYVDQKTSPYYDPNLYNQLSQILPNILLCNYTKKPLNECYEMLGKILQKQ